ncbi:MAG TPA: peptidoglycan DD-metalloendopeptidase family protein [Acidimicrobiia bacterium]|nr:peptidoglycan DD-metalloendopeptidase family protein [Acidimicrobiia bacterium]
MASWQRRLLFVALAVAAGLALTAPVTAQEEPDPRNEDELRAAIGHASVEEQAAIEQVLEVQARRDALEAQARELDARVSTATAALEAAQREVERIDAEIVPVRAEVDRIRAEIDEARRGFENAAVKLYTNASDGSTVLPILSYVSDDPGEIARAGKWLGAVSDDAQRQSDRLTTLKDDLEQAKASLEAQREQAEVARVAVDAERAEVERLRVELEPVRAAVVAEEAEESRLRDEVRARKDEFEQQLAALEAEQAALAELVSRSTAPATSSGSGAPSSGSGRFIWPCDGRVTSGFGYRVHPISGTSRMHTGVDMACGYGAPIGAAGDGVVVEAGWRGGYGNAVVVDHGDGLATLYAHQSRIAVSRGQRVTTGQTLGYVGSTGYSTGPHLHWEVWVNGNPVDPMGYV